MSCLTLNWVMVWTCDPAISEQEYLLPTDPSEPKAVCTGIIKCEVISRENGRTYTGYVTDRLCTGVTGCLPVCKTTSRLETFMPDTTSKTHSDLSDVCVCVCVCVCACACMRVYYRD